MVNLVITSDATRVYNADLKTKLDTLLDAGGGASDTRKAIVDIIFEEYA